MTAVIERNVANEEWVAHPGRNCRGIPVKVFFNTKQAVGICSDCPVSRECLEYALDNYEYGVWGGTTDEDRINIRRGLMSAHHAKIRAAQQHKRDNAKPKDKS